MWTDKNRAKYDRDHLRYPSDLTDDEWAYVEPLIPPARRGGGKRRVDMRAVMNGVMYILSTGCQWRYIPKDFPPRSTLHDYFTWWHCDGTLDRIHYAPDQSSILRSAKSCPTSKPKSSDAPIVPKGSCHYPSVGLSNVRSLG